MVLEFRVTVKLKFVEICVTAELKRFKIRCYLEGFANKKKDLGQPNNRTG